MSENNNIEKLFKDTFKNFEADVNPRVWSSVQSGIKSVSGGATSTTATITLGKVAAGVASILFVTASIWYFSSSDKTPMASEKVKSMPAATIEKKTSQADLKEQQSKEINSSTKQQQITNAKTASPNTSSTSNSKGVSNTAAVSEEVVENKAPTATTPVKAKYGNAPKGDGGMMRGTNQASAASGTNINNESNGRPENNTDLPSATIYASVTSGDAPLTVDFINQGIASTSSWEFDDGTNKNENFITHTFEKPGTYVVKLTSKNSLGSAQDKITIEVKSISSITNIPNIFTPNGDGINDYFLFETKNIASIGVAIYSQAEGIQIYSWNTPDGKWNGKLMNGQDAAEGIYLYSIQAIGTDGIVHSKKGFVTLSIAK